mmetsp:Transcript_29014/g.48750  ORF Transcript_29014/g.48750 Transcript_29014/m.48750 type:complete len:782 (-) Transcript_29014:384-2729(-)
MEGALEEEEEGLGGIMEGEEGSTVSFESGDIVAPVVHDLMEMKTTAFGNALHATLIAETDLAEHDCYADKVDPLSDALLQKSLKKVGADETMRKTMPGPTIKRDKFTYRYWKTWNKEKNLLEDISYKEVMKPMKSVSRIRAANDDIARKKKAAQKRIQMTRTPSRGLHVLAFDRPIAPNRFKGQAFDSHLLGDTNVSYLVKSGMKQRLAVDPQLENSTYDPNEIGHAPAKGGGFPAGRRFLPHTSLGKETTTCDFPPMLDPIRANKGSTFAKDHRFMPERDRNGASTGAALIPPPTSSSSFQLPAGGVFHKAARFDGNSSKESSVFYLPVATPQLESQLQQQKMEEEMDEDGAAAEVVEEEENESEGGGFSTTHSKVDAAPLHALGRIGNAMSDGTQPSLHVPASAYVAAASAAAMPLSQQGATSATTSTTATKPAATVVAMSSTGISGDMHTSDSSARTSQQQDQQQGQHQEEQEQEYVEFEYFPNANPGPGHYQVPRMFDGPTDPAPPNYAELVTKHHVDKPGLVALNANRTAQIGVFGMGCNRHEHVLYGMCLDGRCCRRGGAEEAILRHNDLRRLSGYEKVAKYGRNKAGLREEMLLSRAMCGVLEEPYYVVEPLYAAAYNGDTAAIAHLASLHANPNAVHPESGYSPLHVAVFRCKLAAVAALLDQFRGTLRLDLQDLNGDTALHIAAKQGYVEITSVLCDEDSCDPQAVRNKRQQLPLDVARSHRVFQLIQICQRRNELQQELASLSKHSNTSTGTSTAGMSAHHRSTSGSGSKQ